MRRSRPLAAELLESRETPASFTPHSGCADEFLHGVAPDSTPGNRRSGTTRTASCRRHPSDVALLSGGTPTDPTGTPQPTNPPGLPTPVNPPPTDPPPPPDPPEGTGGFGVALQERFRD